VSRRIVDSNHAVTPTHYEEGCVLHGLRSARFGPQVPFDLEEDAVATNRRKGQRPKLAPARPQPLVDSDSPSPLEWFVDAMATELGLVDNATGRRTRRLLLRLSEWATGEGMAFDREVILDPDTVERFVAVALAQDRSAATYRAVLRRVGPLLTNRAPWEPRPAPIARRQLAPPYSSTEIAILLEDAVTQPTPSRQQAACAFIVLGLGVGLDGRWATRVRSSDVTRRGGGVVVRVGEPSPRSIVALGPWEVELLALAESAGDEFLVGGRSSSNRRTGQLIARLVTPTGHPRLSPARLRSTWLLWHLQAGTRLPELCRAAGLRGTAVFGDLLEFSEPLCEHLELAMLREALW
jgi:hypothetical protein